MPLPSFAQFTVIEADPDALIEAARAGGYDAVGLRIVPPFPTDHVYPVVADPNLLRSYSKIRSLAAAVTVLDETRPEDARILVDALPLSRSGGRPVGFGEL